MSRCRDGVGCDEPTGIVVPDTADGHHTQLSKLSRNYASLREPVREWRLPVGSRAWHVDVDSNCRASPTCPVHGHVLVAHVRRCVPRAAPCRARVLFQTNVHSPPPAPSAMRNGWNHECPIRARYDVACKMPGESACVDSQPPRPCPPLSGKLEGCRVLPLIAMIGAESRTSDTVSESFLTEVSRRCVSANPIPRYFFLFFLRFCELESMRVNKSRAVNFVRVDQITGRETNCRLPR